MRLLASAEEGPEHGYPLHLEIPSQLVVDPAAAVASARRMQHLGDLYEDDSLVALGVFYEGQALVKQARVREGSALLDEAMLAALSDKLKPIWTGVIYCGLLEACHELSDLRRAHAWTEAMSRWCAPLPAASLYPGICRVHRVEILDLKGEWEDAEVEASAACRDLLDINVFAAADGYYAIGELRRRRGDGAAAEEAYLRAHEGGTGSPAWPRSPPARPGANGRRVWVDRCRAGRLRRRPPGTGTVARGAGRHRCGRGRRRSRR